MNISSEMTQLLAAIKSIQTLKCSHTIGNIFDLHWFHRCKIANHETPHSTLVLVLENLSLLIEVPSICIFYLNKIEHRHIFTCLTSTKLAGLSQIKIQLLCLSCCWVWTAVVGYCHNFLSLLQKPGNHQTMSYILVDWHFISFHFIFDYESALHGSSI
jgi:hypothetical protein